jgi:hypothetical protein
VRLWSLHPRYLDAQGLVALWREGLLAQKVLLGLTRGYTNHPQLQRFRQTDDPVATLGFYLRQVAIEAGARRYCFDDTKIVREQGNARLTVTTGQLAHEWTHLLNKLQARSPQAYEKNREMRSPAPHPLFSIVTGAIEDWER